MRSCDVCVVRNRAICAGLSPDELDSLNRIGRHRNIAAGQALIWEGDDALLVANVIEGVLKLSTGTRDGKEQIVGVVYPSDFIGRPFGQRSQHSVTALTDAHLCVFSRNDFDSFAREHPELEHKLLQRTLDELDRARNWMVLLGRLSAAERVAAFLLDMSERLGNPACEGNAAPHESIELPFGRQQIADILGLTIETVSRQIARFKADGIIDAPSRRSIHIVDRAALTARAG